MRKLLFFFALVLITGSANAQFTGLPVTLSQPYDKEVLEDNEPLLVWQADLSTIIDNPRVSMRLTLVEITGDQTPTEAIQVNQPILIRDDLKSNTWSYSSTDTELQPGHHYAWQVSIFFNSVMVQQSEVWEFSIKAKLPPAISFYPVRHKSDISVLPLKEPVIYFTSDEKGEQLLTGTISGKDGVEYTVHIVSMYESANTSNRAKFYKADFSDLKLKSGMYTFTWNMTPTTNRVINFSLQ